MNGKWGAAALAGTLALAVLALTPIAGSIRERRPPRATREHKARRAMPDRKVRRDSRSSRSPGRTGSPCRQARLGLPRRSARPAQWHWAKLTRPRGALEHIVAWPDDTYTYVLMDEREVDCDELLA